MDPAAQDIRNDESEGDNEANADRKTTVTSNEAEDQHEHEDLRKH
jgi:hypothetical protein